MKTLESPLDFNEIKPVYPKGNQSWIFIGRTEAEAETSILWLPDAKIWLIGKDPDWRQEEKGTIEDEASACHAGDQGSIPGLGRSKYWSFSFSISPSKEYSRLISFRMEGLDLLAVQGTLKSLLQHHSSKASILRCSGFFIVQFSHPYMTTGKTIAWLDRPLLEKWCLCFLIHCLGSS